MTKKTVFAAFTLSCVAGLGVPVAQATISLSATPSSQTVSAGGIFTVTLTLNVTQGSAPNNVAGYDTIFETQMMQNGVNIDNSFAITNATPPPSQPNWGPVGPGFPDSLTLTATNHAGYAQSANEGFAGNFSAAQTIATPIVNLTLATYTFSLGKGLALGTYSFDTTLLATSPQKASDVVDNNINDNAFPVNNNALFQITVVPEPGTRSLLALGAVGGLAVGVLRRRTA